MSDLYRLVYVSKNLSGTSGVEATIAQILETSRRNNVRVGVTGALLFNSGAFAQVLEGPRSAVEGTFERIQRDERHGEVTVLQCAPVEGRSFAEWSMGFVGRSAAGQALWSGLASQSGFDLSRLDGDAVFAMLHSLILDEEGVSAASAPPVAPARPAAALDVERIRTELTGSAALPRVDADVRAADPAPARPTPSGPTGPAPSAAALAVLTEALAAERQRTTDLRNVVDGLQVALAQSQELAEHLAGERKRWMRRAQLLARALEQEAAETDPSSSPAAEEERPRHAPSRETPPRPRAA